MGKGIILAESTGKALNSKEILSSKSILKPEDFLKPQIALEAGEDLYLKKFQEKELISLLKKKIKTDSGFFTDGLNTREQYIEKLYIALSNLINEKYPVSGFRIDEKMLDAALS